MFQRSLLLLVIACLTWARPGLAEDVDAGKTALKEAEELELRGDVPNAIIKYQKALESDPNSDSIKASLLSLYCKSEPNLPLDPDFHLHLGQAYQFAGDYDNAQAQYLRAWLLSPGRKNPEAERLLAALSRLRGETPVGETLKKSLDINKKPSDPSAPAPKDSGDFGPYMEDLQRRIRRAWFPPRYCDPKRAIALFKISRSGKMTDPRIVQSSGMVAFDKAALGALENASPFSPLPTGSKETVDIQFTFDYNVFNGRAGSTPPTGRAITDLDLSQIDDLRRAMSFAEESVCSGKLAAASKLYQRILAALQSDKRFDEGEKSGIRSNLECVRLLITIGQTTERTKLVSLLFTCLRRLDQASSFGQTTADSVEQQLLAAVVRNKIPFVVIGNALHVRTDIGINTQLSFTKLLYDASLKDHGTFQDVKALSKLLYGYRTPIQKLAVANEVERRAFEFECKGSYGTALKLYRDALAMKQKDFGKQSEEALAQSGDIARVLAVQGRIPEAQKVYEDTIVSFKKARISSVNYTILLENYGDLLNHIHQQKRAAALYSEAAKIAKKNLQ
jgi:TonB family protein